MTGKSNIKNLSPKSYPNKLFVWGGLKKARLLPESAAWKNLDFYKACFVKRKLFGFYNVRHIRFWWAKRIAVQRNALKRSAVYL